MNTIAYIFPYITLGLVLKCLATFPWYTGLPLTLLLCAAMHLTIVNYVIPIPSNDAVWRTPYFSSIFQASAFWVLVTWIRILLPCNMNRSTHVTLPTFCFYFSNLTMVIHASFIYRHILCCHACFL